MKKVITSSLLIMLIAISASAQYYYIPYLTANQNPGGLNNDTELPLASLTGWIAINASSTNATPVWSPDQTIPFSFSFNGNPVTQFKVSSSAILTFDVTTPLAAPSYNKAALPDASIPDNSVCIWGLASLGTNDNIITKVFGTSPNRQLFIQFNSYGYGTTTPSANYDYTYWSIVLEETTNKIYIVDQRTGGYVGSNLVSAGIQINSTTAVSVAGSPDLPSLANTGSTSANNVYYEFIQGVQPSYDMQGVSITTPAYNVVSMPITLTGNLVNNGTATITSLDINYQVDNSSVVTASLTGLNIASFASYTYSHPSPWTPGATGLYNVKVWATNINGNPDQNNANDTVSKGFGVASVLTQRTVLIEEFTNASCPPCAAQNPGFEAVCNANVGKLALIKYHTVWPGVDPMNAYNQTEVADRVTYYNVTGVPNANMDGPDVPGPSYLGAPANVNQTNIDAEYNRPAFYDITLSGILYLSSGQLDITGSATSHINFPTSDVHIRVALVEDPITYANPPGTNGEANFPQTMRKMFPDALGTSISTPVDGQVDNINFSYVVDPLFVPTNLKLTAWVQDDLTHEVHQSIMVSIVTTGIDELNGVNEFGVFPNPATTNSNIVFDLKKSADVTIEVFNSLGAKVFSDSKGKLDAGRQNFSLNTSSLSNGLYSVNVIVNGKNNIRKMVIEK